VRRVILITGLLLGILGQSVYSENGRVVIQGSTTVLPIAQRCAEVFMKKHPQTDISVRGGGSGTGIAGLIDGICDIAISSREIKSNEIDKAREKGINPIAWVIAKDGIAVIVHPANPVKGLTLNQIKDIYSGKISNWKEVGGSNGRIVVVSRDSASGTYTCFQKLVMQKERVRPDALLQTSNATVVGVVKRTKGAIGYVGLGYLNGEVKVLSVEGIEPQEEMVSKGIYPLVRPLFIYTKEKSKGIVKEFIDFVLGKEGQKIVREEGFIPVSSGELTFLYPTEESETEESKGEKN